MDTSIEYIKMCEKAEEIQKEWQKQDFDYCYNNFCKEIRQCKWQYEYETKCFVGGQLKENDSYLWQTNLIWLPRQDQLQEMLLRKPYEEGYQVKDNYGSFTWLMEQALNWWKNYNRLKYEKEFGNKPTIYPDGEQFWLRFVMKEKYNKIWNGTDWGEIK